MKVNGRAVKSIEESIVEKLLVSISRDTISRIGEVHVSSLCYDCMRQSFYSMKHGSFFNKKTLLTFWMGRKIHETPILSENEISLNWQGIIGSCDDYEDGLLLEKKTCTQIPSRAMSHHVRQAEYYSVMLTHQNKPVRKACILYIDIANKELKVYKARLRDNAIIEKEMLHKKQILDQAIKSDKPPPRKLGWQCNYCTFASICFKKENP